MGSVKVGLFSRNWKRGKRRNRSRRTTASHGPPPPEPRGLEGGILTGDRKGHPENGYDCKIAPGQFVRDAVSVRVRAVAEVLCLLHAVVVIHRIVGELSQ